MAMLPPCKRRNWVRFLEEAPNTMNTNFKADVYFTAIYEYGKVKKHYVIVGLSEDSTIEKIEKMLCQYGLLGNYICTVWQYVQSVE